MKVLIFCALLSAGLAAHTWAKEREPLVSMQALRAQHNDLAAELRRVQSHAPARSVSYHWSKVKRYAKSFYGLNLTPVPKAKNDGRRAHKVWTGKLKGPVLPVLAVAQKMQTLAPVHLEQLIVRDGRAELRLQVWGS